MGEFCLFLNFLYTLFLGVWFCDLWYIHLAFVGSYNSFIFIIFPLFYLPILLLMNIWFTFWLRSTKNDELSYVYLSIHIWMCISSMLEKNFKLVSKVTVTSLHSWQQCIAFFLLWNFRQSGAYLIVSPVV